MAVAAAPRVVLLEDTFVFDASLPLSVYVKNRMWNWIYLFSTVGLCIVGCGKTAGVPAKVGQAQQRDEQTKAAVPTAPSNAQRVEVEVEIDIAAVNALVPPEYKATIEFEKRAVMNWSKAGTFLIAAPKGWRVSEFNGNLVEPDDEFVSIRFMVDIGCSGYCVAKDWSRVVEERVPHGKRIKDVKSRNSRSVIAEVDAIETVVYNAKWQEGDPYFRYCEVTLYGPARALVPAMEKACENFAIIESR